MLSNSDYVREKRKTIIKIYDPKIKQTLQKVHLKDVDKRSLRQTSPRAACAYLLFKIHKLKAGMKGLPPARLVVSQIGDPSERVSKELARILDQIDMLAASFITDARSLKQNTNRLIREIKQERSFVHCVEL